MEELPFPVKSIQVDGGSEFMRDFENDCKDRGPLFVLPPRRPQYNGGVERGNRIVREEFYARNDLDADSVGGMRFELRKAIEKHNTFRPHHSLKGDAPFEYTRKILEGVNLSQML